MSHVLSSYSSTFWQNWIPYASWQNWIPCIHADSLRSSLCSPRSLFSVLPGTYTHHHHYWGWGGEASFLLHSRSTGRPLLVSLASWGVAVDGKRTACRPRKEKERDCWEEKKRFRCESLTPFWWRCQEWQPGLSVGEGCSNPLQFLGRNWSSCVLFCRSTACNTGYGHISLSTVNVNGTVALWRFLPACWWLCTLWTDMLTCNIVQGLACWGFTASRPC